MKNVNKFRRYFDSVFILTKSERNGIIVLISIISLLVLFRFLLPVLIHNDDKFQLEYDQRISQLEKISDSLNEKSKLAENAKNKKFSKYPKREETVKKGKDAPAVSITLFQFDPNKVSYEELLRLGFPVYAAKNLLAYRSKGGTIHKSDDLKKIYGVDSSLFALVKPYICLSDSPKASSHVPQTMENKVLIEINSVDSAMLTTLPGIGPVYASRICRYRNALGGFISMDQLKDVYKLPPETYRSLSGLLTLDTGKVKKINLNFADVKELSRHPYCSYEDAKRIVNYRSAKGYVRSVDQLLKDSVIPEPVYNQLSPYLVAQ